MSLIDSLAGSQDELIRRCMNDSPLEIGCCYQGSCYFTNHLYILIRYFLDFIIVFCKFTELTKSTTEFERYVS